MQEEGEQIMLGLQITFCFFLRVGSTNEYGMVMKVRTTEVKKREHRRR